MRSTIALFVMLISFLISTGQSWDESYVRSLFDGRIIDSIEGVWQFPKDGAIMAIVKSSDYTYDIHLLDSPRLDIKPGTVVGSVRVTPKANYFDGQLTPKALGSKHKVRNERVTFTVNENGTISMVPYKTGWSVSFRRWISYFTRITIQDNNNRRPKDLDGAVRLYPKYISDKIPVCL